MKKIIMGIMFVALFILAIGITFAAVTFNNPDTAGDTINGTVNLSVTPTIENVTWCNWSTTAEGNFTNITNISVGQTNFNTDFDTSNFTDVEDTTLTVWCYNDSSSETGTLVINIDNTAPVCSFTVDREVIEFLDNAGTTMADASTDTTDLTYAWTLWDPDKTSKDTSTDQNPVFEDGDFDALGDYTVGVTITDEASNSTVCTNTTITVLGKDDDALVAAMSGTTTTQGSKMGLTIGIIGGVIFLLIIAAVGFAAVNFAKKGKRKK